MIRKWVRCEDVWHQRACNSGVSRGNRKLGPTVTLLMVGALTACGGDVGGGSIDADKLVIYSGREEQLVAPVIDDFTDETGIEVSVRYGDTAQLAAQLVEEGERTPADVFFSQDGGALGALSNRSLLKPLPQQVLDRVPDSFRSADGTWIGVSGRSRVIVYDPKQVAAEEVPDSVFALTDPSWRGAVGIAPTNASFQAFVSAMRVLRGDDAARSWLEGMKANEVQTFDNNIAVLNAAEDGVIKLGLINHYYWYQQVAEEGAAAVPARLKFLPDGDPGALVNVAGAGVLANSDRSKEARRFVEFLLGRSSQRFFAEETKEYPVISGLPVTEGLPPLRSLQVPKIDLSDLDILEGTLAMIEDAGLT